MTTHRNEIHEVVKERYGAIARSAGSMSCGTGGCCTGTDDPISSQLYSTAETGNLPPGAVDVIISNCVINLSADKGAVLRESFRVLKPGGRFAVSDVVVRGDMSEQLRHDMTAWVGCISGALEETDYATKLRDAGFEDVS